MFRQQPMARQISEEAKAYIEEKALQLSAKADGWPLGKGVVVAGDS